MNPTGRGAVFLGVAACLGCSSDNLPPTEDEFGEVGETSETGDPEPGSGPHGSGCDENWYSLDGLPVEQQGELPEFASLAETPSAARIEFSGPPPAFGHGINDQVIFHEPGPGLDVLWEPATGATFAVEYANYAYPLRGHYRGFGGGASDILWYQPEHGTFEVWQWLDVGPDFGYLPQGPADASLHGIEAGGDYVPLIGDFDGDHRTDIFWYAPGMTADSLWLSSSNQDVVIFDSYEHQVVGQYRTFVGDFNGDGVHDILWYSVADEVEGGVSGIWYFNVDGGHEAKTFSVRGDYTPIVADFDDDGCTDVMWYDGVHDTPQSPIWRCIPGGFDLGADPSGQAEIL